MGKYPGHPFLNFVDPSAPPFSVRIILMGLKYRKIPKISPGAYIFQRPFLRGLFLEGPIHGGKFAFQNRVGLPYKWKEIYCFCLESADVLELSTGPIMAGNSFGWEEKANKNFRDDQARTSASKAQTEKTFCWTAPISRSPALPCGSPFLPDKIIFCAFLCLSLIFSPFLAQNLNFSYSQYGFRGIFARIYSLTKIISGSEFS